MMQILFKNLFNSMKLFELASIGVSSDTFGRPD